MWAFRSEHQLQEIESCKTVQTRTLCKVPYNLPLYFEVPENKYNLIFEFDVDLFLPEQNVLPVKDKSKLRKNKTDSKQKNDKKKDASNGWTLFSDFNEITHIVTKESCVTIYRQDNKTMVHVLFLPLAVPQ